MPTPEHAATSGHALAHTPGGTDCTRHSPLAQSLFWEQASPLAAPPATGMAQFDVKCVSKFFPGKSPNTHDVGDAQEVRAVHFDGGVLMEQQVSAQVCVPASADMHNPERQSLSTAHDAPPT
jgi:hypothetical protein